jgi:predicted kinase
LAIYLLVGAPGAGKSSTAKALARCFDKAVHVPVDDLRHFVEAGLVEPGPDWSEALILQLSLARASACDLALRYQAAGFTVVIDDFWDDASLLPEYDQLLALASTKAVVIHPPKAVALARMQAREAGSAHAAYLAVGVELCYQAMSNQRELMLNRGWQFVDNAALTPEQAAQAILTR